MYHFNVVSTVLLCVNNDIIIIIYVPPLFLYYVSKMNSLSLIIIVSCTR